MDSRISQDQIRLSGIYSDLKENVQKKQGNKKPQVQSSDNRISIDKLSPFLDNIQAISNHNLAVASQLQQENIQLQQQLSEQTKKYKEIKQELHKSNKMVNKLQEIHNMALFQLNNQISQANLNMHNAEAVSKNLDLQTQILKNSIEEKDELIKNLEQRSREEKDISLDRERQITIQLSQYLKKNDDQEQLIEKLKEQINTNRLRIQQLEFQVDKLKSLQASEQKQIEQKNNEWLSQLQTRELKLENEIRLHETKRAQLDLLLQKQQEQEEEINNLKNENQKFQKENSFLSQKNEKLQNDADLNFKEKIKDINESFIIRLSNLEAQLQQTQKDNMEHIQKISQLNHQLKVSVSQNDILKKECDEFEISMDTIKREKQMYLNEFRFLKDKYQETIDQLDNELHRIKLQNNLLLEDNKSLKQTSDHYKQRMQELLDLHEVAALDQDESFYHILQLLKSKGMENVTKEDMQIARQDAIGAMAMNRTAKLVQQQLQNTQWELENDKEFQQNIRDTVKDKQLYNLQENEQWNDLFSRIDNIQLDKQFIS